ncbi:unnamed protein product [Trifolium pratense]|uniref:Uncharacterized protein n=1 Tax=Trifolium pratense TaxID=57577 RepID=A0ACB0JCL9_TRIPR|nr:unnamed protein product [Trifolium pratense]
MAVGTSQPTVVATKDGRIGVKNQMKDEFSNIYIRWNLLMKKNLICRASFVPTSITYKENSKRVSIMERSNFANRILEHGNSKLRDHIIFDFTIEVLNCSRGYDYVTVFVDVQL